MPYGDGGNKSACEIKVFDVIASLYVNAYRYTYENVFNGRKNDGGGIITDTIEGAVFAENSDLETIVAEICEIYRIERDFREEGLYLYRNAGIEEPNTILATLDADELAVTDTSSDGIRYSIATTYTNSSNSTTQIAFNFIDANNEYKPNQLTAKRADAIQTDPVKQISLPFVMSTAVAEKLVNRLLSDSRLAMIQHSFRLPPKYAWIGKGDVIQINHGTFKDVVRIIDTDFNADKSQSVTAQTVGTSTREIVTTGHASYQQKASGDVVTTLPLYFDIPTLTPGQGTGLGIDGMFEMYYGLTPSRTGFWVGAYFARQLSSDGDAYKQLFNVVGQSAKAGDVMCVWRTSTKLKDKRWVTDSDDLELTFGNASWPASGNRTKTQIDADPIANLAVYGAEDRWEIIQFERGVDGKMSGIVRGLRGTEIHCGKHEVGDQVIVLAPGTALMRLPAARIGQKAKYRAVSDGLSFLSAFQFEALPFRGNSRKPFAPYRFRAERTEGDIVFTWTRRDRGSDGWGQALANSETLLSFKVDVCAQNGGVIRTLAATDTQVTYTTDMQSTDGTAGYTKFLLKIAQIGANGAGFEGSELVNV